MNLINVGTETHKILVPKISLDKSITERHWRDMELRSTDHIVPIIDHPKHAQYMAYRQELRDYPSQPDFPNGIRPIGEL